MDNVFEQLRQPFYADELEWKVQVRTQDKSKGMVVTYIDARAVASRLDETLGPENWSVRYIPGPDGGVTCQLSLRINNEWVTKEDGAEKTSVEPVKGGYSSAFRRAATVWGIGRYLYNAPTFWVPLDKGGRPVFENGQHGPVMPAEFYPADADSKGLRPKKAVKADAKAWNAWKSLAEKALEKGIGVSEPSPDITVEGLRKTYEELAKQIKALESQAQAKKPETPPTASKEAAPDTHPEPVNTETTGTELTLADAMAMKVPSGVGVPEKVVGTTLGDAKQDTRMGVLVVRFLAGEIPNMRGQKFEPTEEALVRLQQAAKMVMAN